MSKNQEGKNLGSRNPAEGSLLAEFLSTIGLESAIQSWSDDDEAARPFLSVITRTQGRRPGTLRDVVLALSAQDDLDYEHLILPHLVTSDVLQGIHAQLSDFPQSVQRRTRIIPVSESGRSAPLNVGFQNAKGRYFAVLDDDDMIFDHWISTFRALSEQYPGRVLRGYTVMQSSDTMTSLAEFEVRAVGPLNPLYGIEFDFIQHLRENRSPPVCLAYPRFAFHKLGIRFDETMDTQEDWDYLLKSLRVLGVASAPVFTSVYRQWRIGESSSTLHNKAHWDADRERMRERIASLPFLADARRLLEISNDYDRHVPARISREGLERREELSAMLRSPSWRLTAPLRGIAEMLGKPATTPPTIDELDLEAAEHHIRALQSSISWRITAPIRAIWRTK